MSLSLSSVFWISACSLACVTSATATTALEDAMSSCRHETDLVLRVTGCTTVIDHSRDRRALLRAHNTRGLALCDLDRCAEAVSDFDQVIRINPSIAGYFDNRARALRAAGRTAEALADSDHAIQMAPGYSFVYVTKAHTFQESGRWAEALASIGQAISIEPSKAFMWEFRGEVLGQLGRYEEAYASYDRALAIEPDSPSAYKLRAETETAQGHIDAALDDYARYPSSGEAAAEVASRVAELRSIKAAADQSERDRQAKLQEEAQQESARREADARKEADEQRRRADAEKARADAALARPQQVAVTLVDPAEKAAPQDSVSKGEADRLNKSLGELSAQVKALEAALEDQRHLKAASNGDVATIDATIVLVNQQIELRRGEYERGQKRFSEYLTSIRPGDRDQYASARVASQAFPRVPYYIPGTPETGEFWIEPTVSDTGVLTYQFRFVDPHADYNKVRETISMTPSELADAQAALTKIRAWSLKAHEVGIRKAFSKRAACFPQADCPEDGTTIEGKASTEIRFNVYEDGSTAGRIQRNKGRFVEGYNVSTDSALLLGAYITYAKRVADREYSQGTQTKEDLDKLFR